MRTMPIRTRQPGTTDMPTLRLVAAQRPGGVDDGISAAVPGRSLALDALRLKRALRDPSRRPARWSQPAFGAQVELVRRHLAPVRSRRTLAASYGREAFHLAIVETDNDDPSPTCLAYALRWMELRDGATGPSWPTLLG